MPAVEHAPHHAMRERDEIAAFHDRCSELMRALLDELATTPGRPRTFPQVEDALGWPRRRIASVLGGACRMRQMEFGGRRPYRFYDERNASSGRWEIWMDPTQARAVLSSDSDWSPPAAGTAPVPARSARAGAGRGDLPDRVRRDDPHLDADVQPAAPDEAGERGVPAVVQPNQELR